MGELEISTSLDTKLVDVTTKVLAVFGTLNLKVPFPSVETPILVPFTITDALLIAAPFSSVTFPLIVLFCAQSCEESTIQRKRLRTPPITFFICKF